MAVNLYDVSIPIFIGYLGRLKHILQKGEQHAKATGADPATYVSARLTEDMLPLSFQVQICSNMSKFVPVRLVGAENVEMEDNEKTFADLYTRIDRTVDFLKSVKREQFEGAETKEVTFRAYKFTGKDYITEWVIPNFFFHVTTTYAILRAKGVELGKFDYLTVEKQA